MRQVPQWRWYLDDVFVKIYGVQHYLWCAVVHEGEVLESFVAKIRDKSAALTFLKKAMMRCRAPSTIVTDRLRSYRAAMKSIGTQDRQEVGRNLNNRAENRHLPLRRRERAMSRFRRMSQLQSWGGRGRRPRKPDNASTHALFHNHFNLDRHINRRQTFKTKRDAALHKWRQFLVT